MAIRDCWSMALDASTTTPTWENMTRVGTGFNLLTNTSRWSGQFSAGFDHQTAVRGFRSELTGSTETKMGACFAVQIVVANTAATIFGFNEGTTRHVDLRRDANGFLSATRNGTVLGTGTTLIAGSTWYHIEFYVEVHDTTGVIKVWVNGLLELNLSGLDTRNGGTGIINRWECLGTSTPGSASRWNYTDIVIYDTTGGVADTAPLGDLRVAVIRPSGNGNSSQFVGSDGNSTDNYLLVDDSSMDEDTTYVEASTVGNKDTYAYGDLQAATGTVHAVKVYPQSRKTDAGLRKLVSVARLSGTETDSAAKTSTPTYNMIGDVRTTKPGGGSWSISDVNSAEFGVKVDT